jgi:GTP-binding protein HflX
VLYETAGQKEKLIVTAVAAEETPAVLHSLEELSSLADTAGAVVVGQLLQLRPSPDPGTYLGSGKIEELRDLIESTGATGVLADDELSPAQMKNLEDALNCKVIDRTILILDIFAAHATTSEGKVQVECAQLKYRLTRLSGFGTELSRLGGGIGTRGPGEKKLENDRRVIRDRLARLNRELKSIEEHRGLTRSKREGAGLLSAAIVGYTNAGKSTLLNYLTGAGVLSEDKLFATLDPTTRRLDLPDGEKILLTDTVGFISKLPHHLIEAFKSTLEEARYADFLIHVVDVTDPEADLHMDVVYRTLADLGVTGKPVITLFNKCDTARSAGQEIFAGRPGLLHRIDTRADKTFFISAKTGDGIGEFLSGLEQLVRGSRREVDCILPYSRTALVSEIRTGGGEILSEEYKEDGIHLRANVSARMAGLLMKADIRKGRKNDSDSGG